MSAALATPAEVFAALQCAGCTDPINHPHAFDCKG